MKKVNLSNISLDTLRSFLLGKNYRFEFVRGGHEMWVREGVLLPVMLRIGFDPVPEFVVRNVLRNAGSVDGELEIFMMVHGTRRKRATEKLEGMSC